MKFHVDTREKKKTLKLLRKMKFKFTLRTMDAGDYGTDQCCAERKTIKDLVGSIKGTKAKPGRFFEQMRKLADYCKEEGKIPFLFVSGSLKDEADWYEKRGWKLNKKSIMGAMASATVRYGVNIFAQFSDDEELLMQYGELLSIGELLSMEIMSAIERSSFKNCVERAPVDGVHPKKLGLSGTVGKWKETLTANQRDRIETKYGDLLKELGYNV